MEIQSTSSCYSIHIISMSITDSRKTIELTMSVLLFFRSCQKEKNLALKESKKNKQCMKQGIERNGT